MANHPVIYLTPSEVMMAAHVGIMRQVQNIWKDREPGYGCPLSQVWQSHIEGAIGEKVVAKHLNIYWNGNLGNLKADDVGPYQVRSGWREDSRLILHPPPKIPGGKGKDGQGDIASKKFVLVTGIGHTYTIRGWMVAKNGQKDVFWEDPKGGRPAYFVPWKMLQDIDTLLESDQ